MQFRQGEEEQTAFDRVKAAVADTIIFIYPRIDWPFDTHTDDNKEQVCPFLHQDSHALGCFSQQINEAQK